jgi:phosphoglucosamine mutase
LLNVRVGSKPPLDSLTEIREAIARVEKELQGTGRVLLRYSGTEPVLRVMVEGEDEARILRSATDLKDLVQARLGGTGA